jgi:hypothetical protein
MVITTKLCQLVVDVPALREDHCCVESGDFSLDDLAAFFLRAQSLDEELSQWCRQIPELWLPRMVYSATGETIITYPSISAGSLWNFYRCARMIVRGIIDSLTKDILTLQSSMPDAEHWLPPPLHLSPTQSTHADIVQNMIADICRSIPFMLGEVDSSGNAAPSPTFLSSASELHPRLKAIEGYEMLWPFWHVMQSRFSTLRQRMQAQEALRRLDQDFGIKLAYKLADIDVCMLNKESVYKCK